MSRYAIDAESGALTWQDAWPEKPVRIIVLFAAGGTSDAPARLLGQRLQDVLKQTVIVENKAGASGVIGADAAAKSAPDGDTLLLGTIASHAGAGSSQPLSGEKFGLDAGVDLIHVPRKGSGPSVQDLIAGQIPTSCDTALTTLPFITSGKSCALAVTTAKRAKMLPDVPTLAETGLKGFDVASLAGRVRTGRHAAGDRQAAQRRADEDRRADRARGPPVHDGGRERADDAGSVR